MLLDVVLSEPAVGGVLLLLLAAGIGIGWLAWAWWRRRGDPEGD